MPFIVPKCNLVTAGSRFVKQDQWVDNWEAKIWSLDLLQWRFYVCIILSKWIAKSFNHEIDTTTPYKKNDDAMEI